MKNELDYVVVMITTPDEVTARTLGEHLVEQELAACVNILPALQSIYRWEGSIEQEEEILLLVKTRRELLEDELIPAVIDRHPYRVPEILALPVLGGLDDYLLWIAESTRSD